MMRYLFMLGGLLLVTGCNREAWQAASLSAEADSVIAADLPSARKVKFTAPVNITIQRGNGNVATPTATGKVKAEAAAVGPGSQATAAASMPWWVFGLVFVGGIGLGFWGRGKLSASLII